MMPPNQTQWSMRGAGRSGVCVVAQLVMEQVAAGEAAASASSGGHDTAMGIRAWLNAVEAAFGGAQVWRP